MKIVFATNNKHKLEEIRTILGNQFDILSLSDIDCKEDIPETGNTLEENAWQKAEYIYNKYGYSCFADDTGLEVDALNGAPGIYSARYAAMEEPIENDNKHDSKPVSHDSNANMTRLLRELGENNNRHARFRTVIALIINSQGSRVESREIRTTFEGIVNGKIAYQKSGVDGFGYDPLFIPDGYYKSFAELGSDIKNTISHRARATMKLADFLLKL